MFFSAPRLFSRSAVALLDGAKAAPSTRASGHKTLKQLADERRVAKAAADALKKQVTPPFTRPTTGFVAFVNKNDLHKKKDDGRDLGTVAKENAQKWKQLSEDEKKSYAVTPAETEKYHKDIESFYSNLSPEQKQAAVNLKTIPLSLIRTPRQESYAKSKAAGEHKHNPWIEFYTNFRQEHASEYAGKAAPEVAKAAGEAYKKQQASKKSE